MNTEILGVALQILLLLVISYPLGKHIAKVYKDGNDCMRFMAPIERFIYKLAGINPNEEMDWKAFLKSLLIINVFWFFWGMILLVSQGYLPLNPDGNSGQSPDLAFNTCILPWYHGKDVENIYRYCVSLHDELIPYLFSTVVDAHLTGGSLIRNASFAEESHQVGNALFTKAITSEENTVSFHLPTNGEWIDFWSGKTYAAGSQVTATYPLDRFPLFVKSGSIIPLNITTQITGLGDETMKHRKTILIYPNGISQSLLHLPIDDGITYRDYRVMYDENRKLLTVSGKDEESYTFILKNMPKVNNVKNVSSWKYDKNKKELRIQAKGSELKIQIL